MPLSVKSLRIFSPKCLLKWNNRHEEPNVSRGLHNGRTEVRYDDIIFLASATSQHLYPKCQGPHYFFSCYGPEMDLESYLALYDIGGDRRVVDASVWDLFSQEAVSKIMATVTDAQCIICLRSPIAMTPSLHYQKLYTGHETIRCFDVAWRVNAARRAGRFEGIINFPDSADPSHMDYQKACMLGSQVKRLLRNVDRRKVHFCFLKDISNDPVETFRALCNFLGLDPEVEVDFSPTNPNSGWLSNRLRYLLDLASAIKLKLGIRKKTGLQNYFHRVNKTDIKYAYFSLVVQQEIKAAFRSDIELSSQLTGRNLDHFPAA